VLALGIALVVIMTLLPPGQIDTTVIQLSSGTTLELVRVPAGDFTMGSDALDTDAYYDERPAHTVYLDAFEIGRYEVTVGQFRAFVESTGYRTGAEMDGWAYAWTGKDWERVSGANWRSPRGPEGGAALDDHPVTQVTWDDAAAFCRWVSEVSGRDVRLPTEAQWEKAARGTDGRRYPWADGTESKRLLNHADRSLAVEWANQGQDDGYEFTAPVGSYPAGASPCGALDMAGNVSEWVSDWYAAQYYATAPKSNPSGPSAGEARVLRGGSWGGCARVMRATARLDAHPLSRYDSGGFRVAVAVERAID
jgi:serine/threonine-protein kinase